MLDVQNLTVSYGQVVAVRDLSFSLQMGESLSLLGANGAGKTSAVEAVAGLLRASSGKVLFDEKDITARPASFAARNGLALVPQWRELFPNFTVEENLVAGKAAARNREPLSFEEIYGYFPSLAARRRQKAGSLSGGEQQMLAVGRALIGRPKVLLLDEPSAGLAAGVVRYLIDIIARIRDLGMAILLVEQNLEIARALTDQCIVLSVGRAVWRGPIGGATELDEVKRAYFL